MTSPAPRAATAAWPGPRDRARETGLPRTSRALIYLAMLLSAGHHLDHVLRGTHLGWPLTDQVTPFTISLGVYPLITLGLHLSHTGRVGVGYWLLLSGPGTLFLTAVHLGPTALEPPHDITGGYAHPLFGWLALTGLLTLIALLAATFAYEPHLFRRQRQPRQPRAARR